MDPIPKLLAHWVKNHLRDLPWRSEPRDPYRVWVSEVMLQQTRVAIVVPYFIEFIQCFPDVQALAFAPLGDVLKAWEGLGYYSRARNLHHAAQVIVADYGGQLPHTVKELIKLPGIGRYTAGAIASIAFGEKAPVLDGNVKRILCRLFAIADDPRAPTTEKRLWELAESLLPRKAARVGAFNEAMMELGATVCTPRLLDCEHCPLKAHCQAYEQGIAESLPVKAARKPLPHYDVAAAVIRKRGRLLITQRLPDSMLGGLWEFPGGKCNNGETLEECLRREIKEELGIEIQVGERVTTVRHTYSHLKVTLQVFACRHVSGRVRALDVADWQWVKLDELDSFAFPVTDQKIIAVLKQQGDTKRHPTIQSI